MKLILGALVVAMTMTACSATPAPEPPRRSEPATTTSEPEYGTDEWWIHSAFDDFVEALNSKHDGAGFKCDLDAYAFAESMVQHAVNGTEAELAQLPVVHRLQVYEMRTSNAALGVFNESGALRLLLVASRDLLRPTGLTDLKIDGQRATATVALPGYAPVRISLVHPRDVWLIDLRALFDALSAAVELKGLTADQFVDQKLVERHGAARVAELRKPMK